MTDRAAAAQRAAFESFVADSGDRLLRTAYALCGDWQHAEDLVQQALTAVARHWDDLTAPLHYAHRCLVRANIDRWRVLRRRPEVLVEPVELGRLTATGSGSAEPTAQRLDILAALHALPPRQRAIVVLRYLEDRSEADTADALGISVGAVKSGASRGLATLRSSQPEPADGSRHG